VKEVVVCASDSTTKQSWLFDLQLCIKAYKENKTNDSHSVLLPQSQSHSPTTNDLSYSHSHSRHSHSHSIEIPLSQSQLLPTQLKSQIGLPHSQSSPLLLPLNTKKDLFKVGNDSSSFKTEDSSTFSTEPVELEPLSDNQARTPIIEQHSPSKNSELDTPRNSVLNTQNTWNNTNQKNLIRKR